MGLDTGTPGSCPGPKAGAKPLSHPGMEETGGKRRDLGEWWPGTKCPKSFLCSLVVVQDFIYS